MAAGTPSLALTPEAGNLYEFNYNFDLKKLLNGERLYSDKFTITNSEGRVEEYFLTANKIMIGNVKKIEVRLHPTGFIEALKQTANSIKPKFVLFSNSSQSSKSSLLFGQGALLDLPGSYGSNHLSPEHILIAPCQLSISCEIFVEKKPNTSSSVLKGLDSLLQSENFSDFVIECKAKEFKVHKNILGIRSPVFEKMFAHDTVENRESKVIIDDIEPDIMQVLLRYMYTGDLDGVDSNASLLILAADKYQLLELKTLCEDYLIKAISSDNAIDNLFLADLIGLTKLKESTVSWIVANRKMIMLNPLLKEKLLNNPEIFYDVFAEAMSI